MTKNKTRIEYQWMTYEDQENGAAAAAAAGKQGKSCTCILKNCSISSLCCCNWVFKSSPAAYRRDREALAAAATLSLVEADVVELSRSSSNARRRPVETTPTAPVVWGMTIAPADPRDCCWRYSTEFGTWCWCCCCWRCCCCRWCWWVAARVSSPSLALFLEPSKL